MGDDGLVEIKAPQPLAHLETIRTKAIPEKYVPQVQFQMACTGRKWTDFVSYQPDFPGHLRLFVVRVDRDDAFISAMEADVRAFLAEIEEILQSLSPSNQGTRQPSNLAAVA